MKAIPLPSQAYLAECFDYDHASGMLTWKTRPQGHFKNAHAWNTFNANYAGQVCRPNHGSGYIVVCIDKRRYLSHRVIWKLVTGSDPKHHIDHRNGRKDCNSWDNLRQATHAQNSINRGASASSSTGIKGVVFDRARNRFAAYISLNGRTKFLGRFDDAQQAGEAQRAAELSAHGQFSHSIKTGHA